MKVKLGIIFSFLVMLLLLGSIINADNEKIYLEQAQKLADNGIIIDKKSSPKDYKVNDYISRREMMKIILNISKDTLPTECTSSSFSDVKTTDWGCKYINTALSMGYISKNDKFRPDDNITKVEALKMIFLAKKYSISKTENWQDAYINKYVDLGIGVKFTDYNSRAKRGFVFDIASIVLDKQDASSNFGVNSGNIGEISIKGENPNSGQMSNKIDLGYEDSREPINEYKNTFSTNTNYDLVCKPGLIKAQNDAGVCVEFQNSCLPEGFKEAKCEPQKTKELFFSPKGDLYDKTQNITIKFAESLFPLTNIENQNLCPIKIVPNIPGKCVWLTTKTMQYKIDRSFALGGRYQVFVDYLDYYKSFEILTSDFNLVDNNSSLNKDEKLNIVFNDEISLDKFKENFSIKPYDTSISSNINDYNIDYLVLTGSDLKPKTIKSTITVFPKKGDWGYGENYTFKVKKGFTSLYGNRGINSEINKSFSTEKFLLNSSPFIFKNPDLSDKNKESNLIYGKNGIITKTNPNILFTFNEEITNPNELFKLNIPFTTSYLKTAIYEDNKAIYKENKKQVILNINGNIDNSLNIVLALSKISSSKDETIGFSISKDNIVKDFKFINYKKSCLITSKEINYENDNNKIFSFRDDKNTEIFGQINYYYLSNKSYPDEDCSYKEGFYTYVLQTVFSPSTKYNLTIKKSLIDTENYNLDKDYSFSFNTGKALNEDKNFSILNSSNLILTPKSINPLSITVSSVNLSKLSLKVCEGSLDINSKNAIKQESCESSIIDIKDLGFKPNFTVIDLAKLYKKDFTKNIVYVEAEKITDDKTKYDTKIESSYFLSDTLAVLKNSTTGLLWLNNGTNGENLNDSIAKIEGYKITSDYSVFGKYLGQKYSLVGSLDFKAKENGLYELENKKDVSTLILTLKNSEKILLSYYPNYYNNSNIFTYLQTDKPLYKKGETVNIKGLSKNLNSAGYLPNTQKISLNINSPEYKNLLTKDIIPSKENGSFDLTFEIPKDSKNGNYTISAGNNNITFGVEEYEKPEFKLETKSKNKNYFISKNDKTAFVDLDGQYYIGTPLKAEIDYNITAKKFHFDGGKTTGYSFGEGQNYWYDYIRYENDEFVKNGKTVLDQNGKGYISIDFDKKDSDKIYTVSATATDNQTKKSVSSSDTFYILRSDVFLGIKFDKYYYELGETGSISVVTTDIDGNKLANKDFNLKVYKVDYVDENDEKYNDENAGIIEEKLVDQNIRTQENGIYDYDYKFDKFGEYRFEITNSFGYKTTKNIYISGTNINTPLSKNNTIKIISDKEIYDVGDRGEVIISSPVIGAKALITVEKLNDILYYKVIDITSNNQKVDLDIKKEYLPNFKVKAYIIKSGNNDLESIKDLRNKMQVLEQELSKENLITGYKIFDLTYILPNFNKTVSSDKLIELSKYRLEEQKLLQSILPDHYVGELGLKVNLKDIKLNTKVSFDKNSYLPGDKQKIDLFITDSYSKPINGEVTVAIIDKSLLALKQNKQDIINYFYDDKESTTHTLSNLDNLIKRIDFAFKNILLEETLNSSRTKGMGALESTFGGTAMMKSSNVVGDMAEAPSMAMDMMFESSNEGANTKETTKIRSEFKDLAFYKATVKVINGKAVIEVPKLPDNLTTWTVSGISYTNDSLVGNIEGEFKVQQELSVLPQIPRFFVIGDTLKLGALIVNNSDKELTTNVGLEITNVKLLETKKTETILPNSSKLVEFEAEVLNIPKDQNINNYLSNIKFSAISGDLNDSVILSKKIYPASSEEYVFTNGKTTDKTTEKIDFTKVEKNNSYIELNLGTTILTNILNGLDKQVYMPGDYLYSKLETLDTINKLEEIYKKLDKYDEYSKIRLSDFNGKTYSLDQIRTEIYKDIPNYLQDDYGFTYFKDGFLNFYDTKSDFELTKKYLLLNIKVDGIDNNKVYSYYKKTLEENILKYKSKQISDFLVVSMYNDKDFYTKYFDFDLNSLSNMDKINYIKISDNLNINTEKAESFYKALKNNIKIEARGSYLPDNYSSLLGNIELSKLMISKKDFESLEIENMIRYLISLRNEDGIYFQNNINQVLDLINKYLPSQNLGNVDFSGSVLIGNIKEFFTFNKENKLSLLNKKIDLTDDLYNNTGEIIFEKTGSGNLYYDLGVKYFVQSKDLKALDNGIIINRNYYDFKKYQESYKNECFNLPWFRFNSYCYSTKTKDISSINKANKGDFIVGELEIILDRPRTNIFIKDIIPAGTEVLNTNFDTTSLEVKNISNNNNFDFYEVKDDGLLIYSDYLQAGTYKFNYVLKANYTGKYSLKPAIAEQIDKKEIWGRTKGDIFEIE